MPQAGLKWNSALIPCSIDQKGLDAKLCWWGTRGETVGNVWDAGARHSHGQCDLDSSWRVARMKSHQGEEGETPSAETPGAADTGAGEPRGAETAGSTRPASKKKKK